MQRLLTVILILGIAFMGLNCQKELSYDGPGTSNNNPSPITSTVQGNVNDEMGRPAMGVTIKIGSKTAITDAKGYFRIKNASLDKNKSLVIAEKNGYFKTYRVFGATSGVNQVIIRLAKKTLVGTINSGTGGDVSLTNGSKVALMSNGVVKAAGGAYSGTINVYAAYIDPTDPNISEMVPGSFNATDKNNNRAILSSYGMMVVELESASGEKLQVAPGSKAVLTTAIPAALQSSAPATIPLWYVDEQTGIWKEEGVATKNGTNYVGDVKHFSFWNCDIPFPAITLSGTFKNPDGTPLAYTTVRLRAASTYGTAYGITDSAGQVSGAVPANVNLVLEVLTPCYTVAYTENIGPFSTNTNIGTITTTVNSNTTTMTGRILNCSGAAVTQGYAVIMFNNMARYAPTASDGSFSCTFYTCTSAPATAEMIGVDNSTQQQSAIVNVAIGNPTSVAGDITACGTSAVQYIDYTIDGTLYSITSASGDIIHGNSYDSSGVIGTYIQGYSTATGRNMVFDFRDTRTVGSFPVTYIYSSSASAMNLVPPFNVTITNFPQAGGFYEGGYSGQFMDGSGASHSISCSFRVRRQ